MPVKKDYLETIGSLIAELEIQGVQPVLVGGMALVILGSQRVTNDFDFLVSLQETNLENIVNIFYRRGFELVSKLNKEGEVVRTLSNRKIAAIRLKLDAPLSAYFFNRKTGLKIDLLFDFPLKAAEIAARATRIKIKSHSIRVASYEDLLRLKEIAYANRQGAADAQDLEFLHKK